MTVNDDFIEFIEYFIKNKDKIIKIGNINYKKAKKSYTSNIVEENILTFYREACN